MQPLLTRAQMQQADQSATTDYGLPELLLMEHAALALVNRLERRFGNFLPNTRGLVLAGNGNNGGDVLAATRILLERGCQDVFVVMTSASKPVSTSAQKQLELLAHLGIAWGKELTQELLRASDWILDGILGTGFNKTLDTELQDIIELVNQFADKKWIVSADLPSGLCADTGNPKPLAIRASETVALGFYKRGLVTGQAADFVGELSRSSIQIPAGIFSPGWESFLYEREDALRLPPRPKNSHKGSFGKVSVLAGPAEKEGAAALSSLAALRSGAGLVTVYAADFSSLRARLAPEIMSENLDRFTPGMPDFESVVVIGPGLGMGSAAWKTLQECLASEVSLVLDADALNLMAANEKAALPLLSKRLSIPTVITPHPKEAARLLGTSVEAIQADRYAAARALAEKWQCAVLLKGAGTICTAPKLPLLVVRAGDSGLAKGGTGDVLAGLIAGFLAQGMTVAQSLPLGAYVHGAASELQTARLGHSRSTLASEVTSAIADVLGELECRVR